MYKLVKVIQVTALPDHHLAMTFSDGSSGVADLRSFVFSGGTMVEPLKDQGYFERVVVEGGAPTWPNELDIDPTNARRLLEEAGLLRTDGEAA